MRFPDALDAIRHAAYRAEITGKPWGVYALAQYHVAPLGDLSEAALLEVCQP